MQSGVGGADQAQQVNRSAWLLRLAAAERPLFYLTALAAAAIMWLAPRLPMADLPQHAGQVALWRDLLLGQSSWSSLVHINLLTPYLIGYGLMLPLSFVFSMEFTTRIILTLAFLGFVAASMALRREMGGDRRLDWLFLLPFFGFAWKWGFLTFLVASPLALLFLLLAFRHARAPDLQSSLVLVGVGALLLLAHGLMCLAALFLGGLMMLEQAWAHRHQQLLARLFPYFVLACICLGFRLATRNLDGAMQMQGLYFGVMPWARPWHWLLFVADMEQTGSLWLPFATSVALLAPFALGLRANNRTALMLLAGLIVLLTLMPTDALQTGLLYQRFALFLPVFAAFAFRAGGRPATARALAAQAGLILSCWLVLGIQASRIRAFASESRPFETILAAAKPDRRVLAMMIDGKSSAASSPIAYMHYALWYQAEKHGFVDFNFAVFHPQVIRFRPGEQSGFQQELGWQPGDFKWADVHISSYDYVMVRSDSATVATIQTASPCKLTIMLQDGPWFLLERGACTGAKSQAPAASR